MPPRNWFLWRPKLCHTLLAVLCKNGDLWAYNPTSDAWTLQEHHPQMWASPLFIDFLNHCFAKGIKWSPLYSTWCSPLMWELLYIAPKLQRARRVQEAAPSEDGTAESERYYYSLALTNRQCFPFTHVLGSCLAALLKGCHKMQRQMLKFPERPITLDSTLSCAWLLCQKGKG